MKSKELQELRDRCKNSEEREVTLKSEVDNCQRKLKDKGRLLQKVEAERDELERNMAHYITEVSVSLSITSAAGLGNPPGGVGVLVALCATKAMAVTSHWRCHRNTHLAIAFKL